MIQKGEFREDLYYRLNVMPIHLPPLRERRDDIAILAEHFMRKHAPAVGKRLLGLSRGALQKLQSLTWKGNVRELENSIERAMVLADGPNIEDKDILVDDFESSANGQADDLFNSGMTLKDIEREYIKHVLMKTGNRKEAATRILGIDRKTLYRKERIYGIRPPSPGSTN
jgi:DNA-binding NtrC family response regulator